MPKLSSSNTETYLKMIQMFDGYVPIERIIRALHIVFDISNRSEYKDEFREKSLEPLNDLCRRQYVIIEQHQVSIKITEVGERYLLKLLNDKLPPNPFDEV